MKTINFNTYEITDLKNGNFTATDGKICILFTAEYRKGCYSQIKSIYKGTRLYKSQRYFYPYIALVSDMTFELLKAGLLYDFQNKVQALETYKKDIEPYYKECKEKGLSLYNDTEFLESLFN